MAVQEENSTVSHYKLKQVSCVLLFNSTLCWYNLVGRSAYNITGDQIVNVSSTVVLTCEAEGIPNNITYFWYKNGTNQITNGGKYSGADTEQLTITGIDVTDAGSYECHPVNVFGTVQTLSTKVNVKCELCNCKYVFTLLCND